MPRPVKRQRGGDRARAARPPRPARVPADWSRIVEAATLDRTPGDPEPAHAAFRSLPQDQQMQLARELVETRRAEITRTYVDVISVSVGYRLRRDESGTRRVEPEVCVILVVKKKWKPGSRGVRARRVPRHFFAHWTIGGRRVLCAVPTDVEDGRRLGQIRPQRQIEAIAPAETPLRSAGVIACGIIRDGDDTAYAIGCRHVFGMALILDPAKHHAAQIRLVGQNTVLSLATPIAGRLGNGPDYSFDSQLARVLDADLLSTALDGVKPAERALSWDDIRQGIDYWILTPHGPVRAHFVAVHTEPIVYTSQLNDVRHFQLARFLLPDRATIDGDSGSAVMTEKAGGTLVGMHIGGNGEDLSLVIPAWQLFHAPWYGIADETWKLWQG